MANKNTVKITTTTQTIKVHGKAVLYFTIDIEKKTASLTAPSGTNYFGPLMEQRDIEKHEAFLETYKIGIESVKKIFRTK
jgi:hypothetical protein